MLEDGVIEEKTRVRKEIIARRNAMDASTRREKSKIACARMVDCLRDSLGSELDGSFLIALFSSFGSEVELGELERFLVERGCRVCYPGMVRMEGRSRPKMLFFELAQGKVTGKTAEFLAKPARSFELQEILSQGAKAVDVAEINFAVIPLVAFDETGARLGYGGGNYDEFLRELPANSPAVGIAFEEQRVDRVPCEPHDLRLARIVSA